jgi:hypothetical protein
MARDAGYPFSKVFREVVAAPVLAFAARFILLKASASNAALLFAIIAMFILYTIYMACRIFASSSLE